MLEIDKNKVQINLGPNVEDMTTRNDPPRRGRVNHNGGLLKRSPTIIKSTVPDKACSRPKPRGVLRHVSVNHHV